jgi:hypothetical protein
MVKWILMALGALFVVILVWGFIGGLQAQNTGITCDTGVGKTFCWVWHTNIVGQAEEFLDNVGNAIKDSLN